MPRPNLPSDRVVLGDRNQDVGDLRIGIRRGRVRGLRCFHHRIDQRLRVGDLARHLFVKFFPRRGIRRLKLGLQFLDFAN